MEPVKSEAIAPKPKILDETLAPIARALSGLDKGTEEKVRKLFDIAYFIAVEGLAFSKMKPLCELQQRHGVNLGET